MLEMECSGAQRSKARGLNCVRACPAICAGLSEQRDGLAKRGEAVENTEEALGLGKILRVFADTSIQHLTTVDFVKVSLQRNGQWDMANVQ